MPQSKNRRKIGLISATAFAIGAMIGGGVFVLSGVALRQAGPAALLSFIIAGIIVLLSALSFAVIASQAKEGEGGYTYVGTILGNPIWSFLTSWCFYLGGIIGAAFVLGAFGDYAHQFIASGISSVDWALIGAALLTLVNLGPASAIGRVETILVAAKLLVLGALIVPGLAHIHASALSPFAAHGATAIFSTSASLFIAFLGFNVITNISGDIDNPRRTVPRAILLSMGIVMVVYAGVVIALSAAHLHSYNEASVGVAARQLIGPIGGGLVIAGALVATLSSANANILGSSEIMVRMAANKEVPTRLGALHRGHPYASVAFNAICYVILILLQRANTVIGLANVTAIVALVIVNIAATRAIIARTATGFRLPLGWVLPVLASIGAVAQFWFIGLWTSLAGIVFIGAGLAIYATRNRWHDIHMRRDIVAALQQFETPLTRVLRK